MATSKSKTSDGRRRNKHSLFANTFDSDTVLWKPREGIRRRSRQREELGKHLGRMRQLRSFTSWRDMKIALESPLSSKAEGKDSADDSYEASSLADDQAQPLRLEPARLSLPEQYETRGPKEQTPLTLLFLKEDDANECRRKDDILPQQPNRNGEKVISLVYTHCQWKQLADQTTQRATEKEETERRALDLINRKQLSLEMARTWDNTYVNIRKRRYEKRKERLKKEKEYKEKVFRQLKEENQKIKNQIREKAKNEAFYEQDCTKRFHSAFRISEVQAERQAQLEFNKKLKMINKEIEVKYAQSIMDDAKRFKQEQEEEKKKILEVKRALGAEAQKSYLEAEKIKKSELEQRNKEEREDIEIMRRQLEQVIENERNEIIRKKELVKKNLIENRELLEKSRQLAKLEEEEENRAIEIISNGKMRIAKIRKEKEEEMLTEKRNRHKELSNTIQNDIKEKLEKEEESYERAVEEKNFQYQNSIDKEKQYREMLRTERINDHLENMKKEEVRLEKERELLKWEILRRFKREELNNQFSNNIKDKKIYKALEFRNVCKQQIESDIDRRVKEKEIDLEAAKKSQENWDMNDKQFLEYAYKVREESKNKGRPLFPLDAAIYGFKKKNQLTGNVRNFIYDAKIQRPDGIKDYEYKTNTKEEKENYMSCKCPRRFFNTVLEREECGCPKKANGL